MMSERTMERIDKVRLIRTTVRGMKEENWNNLLFYLLRVGNKLN